MTVSVLDLDVFLALDYSQAEIRILAEISGDKLLISQFNSGPNVDIHSLVGSELTGWPVERIKNEKATRKMVKNMIFGIVYGIGRDNLYDYIVGKIRAIDGPDADLTGITPETTVELYDKFFERYTGVNNYIHTYRHMAEVKGFVPTMFGFQRQIRPDDNERGTYWLNQAINCVDFDTLILTKRGWITGRQLTYGDYCLTETGWQRPINIARFPDYSGPVHVWQSKSLSAVSTPEHRWKVDTGEIETTENIKKRKGWGQKIWRTIPEVPVLESYSDDFVQLCGWVLTDGHYSSSNETGVQVTQSKPKTKKQIQKLMHRMEVRTGYESNGCRYWYVGGQLAKNIRMLFPDRVLTEPFISSLSRRQANLLINTMLLGDGNNEKALHAKRVLSCGTARKAEAFEMLCAWAGHATRLRMLPPGRPVVIKKTGQTVIPKNPIYLVNILRRKYAQIWKEYETIETGNGVWCPTFADDAAWVAQRDGVTYITKNTPIQGSAHQLVLMAMAILHMKPQTYNLLQRPCMEVHDALYFFVKFRDLPEAYKQAINLLEHEVIRYAAKHFKRRLRIPMLAEASAGFCLGSLTDYTGEPVAEFLPKWQEKHKKVQEKSWAELVS